MNYLKLKDELLLPAYSGMTTVQKRAALLASKTVTRQSISGTELFGYTDSAEYTVLANVLKQQWLGLCAVDIVPKAAVPIIKSIFDGNSTTWANIVKTETTTRANEIGFPNVQDEDIRIAEVQ